jgi:hypothetical protein
MTNAAAVSMLSLIRHFPVAAEFFFCEQRLIS